MQRDTVMTTMMRGEHGGASWDVDTKEGLANAVEWMERHVTTFRDQGRWITPRSGSIVVLDQLNKQAIRVLGLAPETGTRKVFEAMGWRWIDRAAGEEVE